MTTTEQSQTWFTLPDGARDWLRPGQRHTFWLPPVSKMSDSDWLAGFDQLTAWDALVGRMMRGCLFDATEDCRRVRKDAEAVAAVAEALAVRLGVER